MIKDIVEDVLFLVKTEPQIADTIGSWFASNPDASPEAVQAKLAEYKDEVASRHQVVDDFSLRTGTVDPNKPNV